jgi:hypothetical protein
MRPRTPLFPYVLTGTAIAVALAYAVFTAAQAPSAKAVPAPLETAQVELANSYGIDISVPPPGVAVAVSEADAKAAALTRFGQSPATSVDAFQVTATDTEYSRTLSDGTQRLIISDRAVWVVLIPNMQIPLTELPGHSGPEFYTATLAVFSDAQTGDYLLAATL